MMECQVLCDLFGTCRCHSFLLLSVSYEKQTVTIIYFALMHIINKFIQSVCINLAGPILRVTYVMYSALITILRIYKVEI